MCALIRESKTAKNNGKAKKRRVRVKEDKKGEQEKARQHSTLACAQSANLNAKIHLNK